MTASKIFAEFPVVFCLFLYVLLVGLNEQVEVPSGDTLQVGIYVTGLLSIHDTT